jgi:hypothetical protein
MINVAHHKAAQPILPSLACCARSRLNVDVEMLRPRDRHGLRNALNKRMHESNVRTTLGGMEAAVMRCRHWSRSGRRVTSEFADPGVARLDQESPFIP